ncbi:MAG: hypothetical protein WC735_04420 [Candidatus Paceibacterota bacterium]|jgi:hypothetical protein
MIREFEFFHGVIFSKILHASQKQISIKPFPTSDNASYVLNDKVGIYIKYSTKRLSPWRFSFQKRHQDEILEMQNAIGETFLLLVCNDDGVACLSFEELRQVLNESHEEVEWVSVTRTKGKMYSVKGSDGQLEFKLGKDDFSEKVLANAHLSAEEKPYFSFSWFKNKDKQ